MWVTSDGVFALNNVYKENTATSFYSCWYVKAQCLY